MNQELKFNGYTAQPSDYECQDGDLAAVLNLMPEKGALHPVSNPKVIKTLISSTRKVVLIHTGSWGTHYIIYDSSNQAFYWMNSTDNGNVSTNYRRIGNFSAAFVNVQVLGNVLIVLTSSGMKYFMWEDTNYRDMGEMGELTMQFRLDNNKSFGQYHIDASPSGLPKSSQTGFVSISQPYTLSNSNQQAVTEPILAQVNKAVADAHQAGYFVMPFFVRYAYRLFDGTTTKLSPPVLLLTSTKTPYLLKTYDGESINFYGRGSELKYIANIASEVTAIKKWKGIINSVDIFISAPIYNYDQAGVCKRMLPGNYCTEANGYYGVAATEHNGTAYYELPSFDDDKLLDKFRNVSAFYLYHSIPLDDLTNSEVKIDAKQDYLPALTNREVLEDDYNSHDKYIAKGAINYNSRLNLFGLRLRKFDGFHPSACFQRNNTGTSHTVHIEDGYWTSDYEEGRGESTIPYWVDTSYDITVYDADYYTIDCYVHLKIDGVETVVLRPASEYVTFGQNGLPKWFYYPDARAYKAVFVVWYHPDPSSVNSQDPLYANVRIVELQLKEHALLNGAYYFDGFAEPTVVWTKTFNLRDSSYQDEEDVWREVSDGIYYHNSGDYANIPASCAPFSTQNTTVPALNKLYTSEINNPFKFGVTNINTIGSGEILGISTAAKALSQGQFGQFPLYAFTTDGVWALEVSSATGAFSAKQPITRDVCINANSITQIDSAVLFATNRGIMLISGSQTQCITETIDNNEEPFSFASLPLASNIKTALGITSNTNDELSEKKFKSVFLAGCQMLYAYDLQRIIVFNPSYKYAFVYSLESKNWGIISSSGLSSKIVSYPQAYAMLSDGKMVDFSQEGNISEHQFLLTRPIKLDPSLKDVTKTIDTIITRGAFQKGHVQTVLYGSRDLINWFPVSTSIDHYLRHFRGTPYKYFRIALVCSLTHDESIWGASIQYTPRLTNQPR